MGILKKLGLATVVLVLPCFGAIGISACSSTTTSGTSGGDDDDGGSTPGTKKDSGSSTTGTDASKVDAGNCDPNNGLGSSNQVCNDCIQTKCGNQNRACSANCGCQDVTTCILGCRDQQCIIACQQNVAPEALQLFVDLDTCLGTCVGDGGTGPCGSGPTDAGGGG